MYYRITPLKENLIYIKWYRAPRPNTHTVKEFITDLQTRLDTASVGLYFISDLRQGRIVDMRVIQQLAGLSKHERWAGSTAFSDNPVSNVLVRSFSRFAGQPKEHREIWTTPEEAIAYLESVKPGLSDEVDWKTLLDTD
ncbi:MAG: hypothetical protein JNJ61_27040 [Anaerolineae bacterium]|nr:hypothetical protein [Anaerolineae bacterium]